MYYLIALTAGLIAGATARPTTSKASGFIVKGVACVAVKVVVDCVQECVTADFGTAARCVMDVVALECDEVRGAEKQYGPVVTTVASRGPRGRSIEFRVGDCHSV